MEFVCHLIFKILVLVLQDLQTSLAYAMAKPENVTKAIKVVQGFVICAYVIIISIDYFSLLDHYLLLLRRIFYLTFREGFLLRRVVLVLLFRIRLGGF